MMDWDDIRHVRIHARAAEARVAELEAEVARLRAEHIPREDLEEAAHAIAEAAECGASLASEIGAHMADPWRWQYPNVYLSDDAVYLCAVEAAQMARRAWHLLNLEKP